MLGWPSLHSHRSSFKTDLKNLENSLAPPATVSVHVHKTETLKHLPSWRSDLRGCLAHKWPCDNSVRAPGSHHGCSGKRHGIEIQDSGLSLSAQRRQVTESQTRRPIHCLTGPCVDPVWQCPGKHFANDGVPCTHQVPYRCALSCFRTWQDITIFHWNFFFHRFKKQTNNKQTNKQIKANSSLAYSMCACFRVYPQASSLSAL